MATEVGRSSVEERLNELLDAEVDQICRALGYERKLETKAGEVRLRILKLRRLPFETAISERHKPPEASVEAALVEMYLAAVSVRRVEDITEELWGTRMSSGTDSWQGRRQPSVRPLLIKEFEPLGSLRPVSRSRGNVASPQSFGHCVGLQ